MIQFAIFAGGLAAVLVSGLLIICISCGGFAMMGNAIKFVGRMAFWSAVALVCLPFLAWMFARVFGGLSA